MQIKIFVRAPAQDKLQIFTEELISTLIAEDENQHKEEDQNKKTES
jgi:hypothetical protein